MLEDPEALGEGCWLVSLRLCCCIVPLPVAQGSAVLFKNSKFSGAPVAPLLGEMKIYVSLSFL